VQFARSSACLRTLSTDQFAATAQGLAVAALPVPHLPCGAPCGPVLELMQERGRCPSKSELRSLKRVDEIPPNYPLPTAQVQPYVDVLGEALAIEFLLNFGGSEVMLACDPKGRGMVERCIGQRHVAALAQVLPMIHRVPLSNPWLAKCLYAQGLSIAAIARHLRVSDVTIRRYIKGTNSRPNPFRLKVVK